MKKFLAILMAFALVFALAACGGNKAPEETTAAAGETAGEGTLDHEVTVGIIQLVQHPALDAATEGFKRALTEKLGDKVKFDEQNAAGDTAACATITNKFASDKVDLIMANATPALQAAAAATTEIPILGTSVTEYGVALDIKDFNGTVGGNISGTSDLAPLDKQAQMFIDLLPDAKTIGLVYCSAEPNSKYQVTKVAEYLTDKGLECKEFPFSDSNDLASVAQAACDYADALYVPTDNTVASSTGTIDGICRAAKVPVIAGEEGICAGCGIATLSISYDQLGYTTGLMAARILGEGADISTMAIEYDENYKAKYNADLCTELGITVPSDYEAIEIAE